MTRRVLKYHFDQFEVVVPAGNVVAFAKQRGNMWVWVQVSDTETEKQTLVIHATGSEIPWDEVHVDSWVSDTLVWHLYRKLSA